MSKSFVENDNVENCAEGGSDTVTECTVNEGEVPHG